QDASGSEGGDHVLRDHDALRIELPVERAEHQVEHQRERQHRDAIHGHAQQLEELELGLDGDDAGQVAARAPAYVRVEVPACSGGGRGVSVGSHAAAPFLAALVAAVVLAGWFERLRVSERNASSRPKLVTSRPERWRSRSWRARTVSSAALVRSSTAAPTRSKLTAPGSASRSASLSVVLALIRRPAVLALMAAGVPSATILPWSSTTMRSASASASSR